MKSPLGRFLTTFAAVAVCTSAVNVAAKAAAGPSATVTSQDLRITAAAVDPGVFHIVIYPTELAAPPSSPFVVENKAIANSITGYGAGGYTIKTSQAVLTLGPGGRMSLKKLGDLSTLVDGTVYETGGILTLALAHDAGQRLYGAGNSARDIAGDLTHPTGTENVSNGTTRIPFIWSTGNWGALIANDQTGMSWSDASNVLTWKIPSTYADIYLSVGNGGYGLLNAYSRLTGRAPIPPRWTFGYMQSRWGYTDSADVQEKWQHFRDLQIPIDAFIYDYDWFVNDWEFNPTTFPTGSLTKMKEMGLHFVGIRKPRVNDANQDFARQQGWLLNSPQGTDLRFDVPAARYWWWSHHQPLVDAGVSGWWNDEAEQTPDEFFLMAQTEFNGGRQASVHRPWSISRAFAPGMQRYGAAAWSGDIDSNWETLSNQPGTLLNWGLAGMPYSAQDIGGFIGTPTPELYARWIEEGVFVPVMRAHGNWNSPRWPWAFGDDVLAATKKAIELRYRLIPYNYTLAAETNATGAPIIRPLFLEFPNDSKTFNLEDEWLLGSRLLAAPILTQVGARDVYLPLGGWYDFNTGAAVSGGQTLHVTAPLDLIPAYVRAGSIIPLGPVIQSTALGTEDPLDVKVYPGANAAFSLYEDDGDTYGYQSGQFSRIPMNWNDKTKTFTFGKRIGSYPGMLKTRHLNIVLPNGDKKSIDYIGAQVTVRLP